MYFYYSIFSDTLPVICQFLSQCVCIRNGSWSAAEKWNSIKITAGCGKLHSRRQL